MDGTRYVRCREAAMIGANELTGDVGMEADQPGDRLRCSSLEGPCCVRGRGPDGAPTGPCLGSVSLWSFC